jgi:CheY-like chemotaxis protein
MNKKGPIVIIEDDEDDQLFLAETFKNLAYVNEIIFFKDGQDALNFLTDSIIEPFIILSDINMPKMNGLELRQMIHDNEDLRLKCIPYLYFTTTADQRHVVDAYSKSIQGFFIKPIGSSQMNQTIKKIVEYWQECISPNYVK